MDADEDGDTGTNCIERLRGRGDLKVLRKTKTASGDHGLQTEQAADVNLPAAKRGRRYHGTQHNEHDLDATVFDPPPPD